MKVPKKIKEEIIEFCKLNKIKNIDKFTLDTLQIGFNVEKYGNAPWQQEIEIEKEVIKEIIKEVPVEKIVEKEIIKEIMVEREVFITDDKKVLELGEELNNLRGKIRDKEREIIGNATNMKSLNDDIENKKKEITNLGDKLEKINKDLKNIPKEQLPPDFYGDDTKGGFWGSNLLTKK